MSGGTRGVECGRELEFHARGDIVVANRISMHEGTSRRKRRGFAPGEEEYRDYSEIGQGDHARTVFLRDEDVVARDGAVVDVVREEDLELKLMLFRCS